MNVIELCEFGHKVQQKQLESIFNKKVNGQPIDRGIAFPVCISVNETVCNFSPLSGEEGVSSTIEINLSRSNQVCHDGALSFSDAFARWAHEDCHTDHVQQQEQ